MSTSSRHLGALLAQRGLSPRAERLALAELRVRISEGAGAAERETSKPGAIADATHARDRVWIVAPARAEPKGLEALLGITRQLGLTVDGFLDSATVVTAALAPTRPAIVLELGLHHAAATAVDCEAGQAKRRRTVLTERGGLIELQQVWLDLIGTTMVKRTRFDPLHDATTEQQLFDELPTLTREAAMTGSATAAVTKGKDRYEIALSRDQLAQAAEPIYRAILSLLHQLRPAGAPRTVVLPSRAAQLPGMRQLLEQLVGCELVSVPDGFAAAAASLLDLPEPLATAEDSVRMLRRLPIQPAAFLAESVRFADGVGPTEHSALPESITREELGQRRSGGPAPSHVLLDGRAYLINTDPLVVGRTLGTVQLPDGLAGVSRRHCTFVREGEDLVLLDHSTFGTFVNGERVHERVRVYAGDRVRLGEPGVELALIAVGEVPAAAIQQP